MKNNKGGGGGGEGGLFTFLPHNKRGGGLFERGGLIEDLRYSAEGVRLNFVTSWSMKDSVRDVCYCIITYS